MRKSVAQSSKEEARSKTGPLDGDEVETTDNSLLADDSKQTVTPVKDAKEPIFADSKHHSNVTHSAEAAKVDPKAPLDRPEMHLVVKQIADRMELLAATRPKQGVTIQLQPEHLGEIVMTVKALGSSVDAQISASDERVRTALQQNGSMLVQAMNQRGIKLENVSISAQLQQSTSGHRDAAQQQ
jgi:flagellar hook-length control protein FliK